MEDDAKVYQLKGYHLSLFQKIMVDDDDDDIDDDDGGGGGGSGGGGIFEV